METDSGQNTHGTPDGDQDADTASGGAPEPRGTPDENDTTDENGRPVDNPSGG
ncbi:MAG: hypothetical protein QM626_04555 [Microbacterium sp.]|uniref:hypothetical protein n=1 Tax=Microbacterium sp. TaxID=51671 RepID=UPI0039E46E0A